jgi:uncharacterized membrane protein
VRSVKGGIETSRTGEARFFYEDEAHLRRVTTARLEELFGREGCVVADLFFTGHMWGAIQYFAAQPSATGILVDHRRARGRRAALTMLALQAGFAFLRPTVRIHRTELRPRIARARGTRRLALAAAAALKPAAGVVSRALDRLTEREWHTRKREPNGSAQFLVFAKTGKSGAGAAGNRLIPRGWRRVRSSDSTAFESVSPVPNRWVRRAVESQPSFRGAGRRPKGMRPLPAHRTALASFLFA